MPNVVQSLRSITPGARPTGKLEGELYVNLPDKQFGMIDETGAPVDLGAVRHFSELASYVIGDHVVQKGRLFYAIEAVSPAPFNEAQWMSIPDRIYLTGPIRLYVEATGDNVTGDGSQTAPWATLQYAVDYISRNFDFNSFAVDLNIGAGTFAGFSMYGASGTGSIYVRGAGIDITTITKGPYVSCFAFSHLGEVSAVVDNFTFIPDAGCSAIEAYSTNIQINRVVVSTASSPYYLFYLVDSEVDFQGGPTIEIRQSGVVLANKSSGPNRTSDPRADVGIVIYGKNCNIDQWANWILSGTPDTGTFARLSNSTWGTDSAYTMTGSINGKKFNLTEQTNFNSDGQGLDYLPGTDAGTWDTSSFYDGVQGGERENIQFSETKTYTRNDVVTYDNGMFRATSDLPPGPFYIWDWQALVKIPVITDLVFSVDQTIGNDTTGDGSAATPWATIGRALRYLRKYIEIRGTVKIAIGPGDFTAEAPVITEIDGNGILRLEGAGSAATVFGGVSIVGDGKQSLTVYINKVEFRPTYAAMSITNGASVILGDYPTTDIVISPAATDVITVNFGSKLYIYCPSPTCKIEVRQKGVGYWGFLCVGQFGGDNIIEDGGKWEFTGIADWYTHGFIFIWNGGKYQALPGVTYTMTVPPGGRKFEITEQASVWTNGYQGAAGAAPGGINFFPGTDPGWWGATSSYDAVWGDTATAINGGTF